MATLYYSPYVNVLFHPKYHRLASRLYGFWHDDKEYVFMTAEDIEADWVKVPIEEESTDLQDIHRKYNTDFDNSPLNTPEWAAWFQERNVLRTFLYVGDIIEMPHPRNPKRTIMYIAAMRNWRRVLIVSKERFEYLIDTCHQYQWARWPRPPQPRDPNDPYGQPLPEAEQRKFREELSKLVRVS